jgi:phosphoribosylanthranilate isomerase
LLSGGIDPSTLAAAIAAVHPFAVDSASGTEAEPGVKDPAKVESLIAQAREAGGAPQAA